MTNKTKIDYMKPSGWKKVTIKDNTKEQTFPSMLAMERQLIKATK